MMKLSLFVLGAVVVGCVSAADTCSSKIGDWSYQSLSTRYWPTSTNPNVFYFGCKVWKPKSSGCTGTCQTSSSGWWRGRRTTCRTCSSSITWRIRPTPRCWVIQIADGSQPVLNFQEVSERTSYRYTLTLGCSCKTCIRRRTGGWWRRSRSRLAKPGTGSPGSTVEDHSEDDVTGRPAPPAPSAAERASVLQGVGNPAIRGILTQGSPAK